MLWYYNSFINGHGGGLNVLIQFTSDSSIKRATSTLDDGIKTQQKLDKPEK